MKSDATLRVFDMGGQYLDSALAADSVLCMPCSEPTDAEAQLSLQPATLDEVETMLSAHPSGLSKEFAQWLVRICRASDARIVELESQVKQKQADFNGLISEWQDLADENRTLKQQAEVDRVVCDAQERTILELQARVKQLESAIGTQLNELLELDQSSAS